MHPAARAENYRVEPALGFAARRMAWSTSRPGAVLRKYAAQPAACAAVAGLGLVVRGDVDDGGRRAGRMELPVEVDAGHAAQLDVQHQAVELGRLVSARKASAER